MGTWGAGAFDNDDAAEWAYELADASDLTPARQALAAATDTDGYLEMPEGACAVAGAAVVAACFDGDLRGMPDEVGLWIDDHPGTATPGDSRLALDALERVASQDSELRAHWMGTPDGTAWVTTIAMLGHRLAQGITDDGTTI